MPSFLERRAGDQMRFPDRRRNPPRLAPVGADRLFDQNSNRILPMATRHSCALARQPRSLPFLVLYNRNGIFNRVPGSTKFVRRMVANHVLAVRT
jgi:hypothetical protein